MKIIEGTGIIDNSFVETACEISERVFDNVINILNIEHKCLTEDADGDSCNTELGQELFEGIYIEVINYLESVEYENNN